MTRSPSPTALHRQLQEIIKRMEIAETTLKEQGILLQSLENWHQNTEFAKKILKEYQDGHPESNTANTINGRAWAAILAALAALTAVVLALSRLIK